MVSGQKRKETQVPVPPVSTQSRDPSPGRESQKCPTSLAAHNLESVSSSLSPCLMNGNIARPCHHFKVRRAGRKSLPDPQLLWAPRECCSGEVAQQPVPAAVR